MSYTALSLFERCSYRYYAERVVGLRPADAAGRVPGQTGLAATEIGDAVHRLLEQVDLGSPTLPDLEQVRAWYPAVTDEELERIRGLVAAYCDSDVGRRVAELPGASVERPFAFEHDGVLLHGRLDVLHQQEGRAVVVDYKTNILEEALPEEIVEEEYRLQRLVYALACFRAGAEEVEVVYQFLERPDAVVSTTFERAELPTLEAGALRGDRTHPRRAVHADAERAGLRGLSGARRGVCRSPPAAPGARRGARGRRCLRSFVHEARRRVGPKRAGSGRSSSACCGSTPTRRSPFAFATRSSCWSP